MWFRIFLKLVTLFENEYKCIFVSLYKMITCAFNIKNYIRSVHFILWDNVSKLCTLNSDKYGKLTLPTQFLAYVPKMKVGLSNHLSVCLCPPPNNF
jgi:hypothetical protein